MREGVNEHGELANIVSGHLGRVSCIHNIAVGAFRPTLLDLDWTWFGNGRCRIVGE